MLTEKEKKTCRMLLFEYKRKLKRYVSRNTSLSATDIVAEYKRRFYQYMVETDMGEARGKFISYLILSPFCAISEVIAHPVSLYLLSFYHTLIRNCKQ